MISNAWVAVFWFCEDLAKSAIANFDPDDIVEKKPVEETIFDRLLTDNARRREKGKKANELTYQALADESVGILNAGTEPTATMLTYAIYFFLRYPEIQDRIYEELGTIKSDENGHMPLQQIEALPYFVRVADIFPCN